MRYVGVAIVCAACAVAAQGRSQAQLLQEGLRLLEARGDARSALGLFEQAAAGPDRSVAARATLYTGVAAERLGQQRAMREYERVVRDFGDQPDVVSEARRGLAAMRKPPGARGPSTIALRRAMSGLPATAVWLGTMSRDGRAITYMDEDGRMALADTASGERIRTLLEADEAIVPGLVAVSPDATATVFVRETPDGVTELTVSRRGASSAAILRVERGESISIVEWPLPDRILCQIDRVDGSAIVRLVDPERRTWQDLLHLTTGSSRLALSPDGATLAFDGTGQSSSESFDVLAATVPGGAVTRLVEDAAQPVWTQSGDRLLFLSNRTGTTGVWSVQMSRGAVMGAPALLQQDLGRVSSVFGVSADTYYYHRQVGLVDVFTVRLDERGLAAEAPRGAARSFIGSNMGPSISPDGRTLVFLAQSGFFNREAIGLHDVESKSYRTLATGMRFLRTPRWSPDGTRILVRGSDASGRFGFHLIDPVTGAVTPVLTVAPQEESELGAARWSSDGEQILYSRQQSGEDVLILRTLGSGVERELARYPQGVLRSRRFEVSPSDGAVVVLESRPGGGAVVVRRRDQPAREVLRFDDDQPVTGMNWFPDGTALLLERRTAPRTEAGSEPLIGLWRIGVAGGTPQPLGIEMHGLRMASVSPTGKLIAFTSGAPVREVWALEHFLPDQKPPRAAATPIKR